MRFTIPIASYDVSKFVIFGHFYEFSNNNFVVKYSSAPYNKFDFSDVEFKYLSSEMLTSGTR